MNKPHTVGVLISIIGISMIVIALIIVGVTEKDNFVEYKTGNDDVVTKMQYSSSSSVKETNMTVLPSSELEVALAAQGDIYSGETAEEVAAKLNRYLGTDLLAGKGELIATYSIDKGVDPYLAAAVMLHETGCSSKCSALVRTCNNVAGQKGSPNCSGSYKGYDTLDDGIKGAIDNLYKNYYAKGYNTVELIGPRYAESNTWVSKITGFMNKLKS